MLDVFQAAKVALSSANTRDCEMNMESDLHSPQFANLSEFISIPPLCPARAPLDQYWTYSNGLQRQCQRWPILDRYSNSEPLPTLRRLILTVQKALLMSMSSFTMRSSHCEAGWRTRMKFMYQLISECPVPTGPRGGAFMDTDQWKAIINVVSQRSTHTGRSVVAVFYLSCSTWF